MGTWWGRARRTNQGDTMSDAQVNVRITPARDQANWKRMSIKGCARCDGDGHKDLVFKEFANPVELDDGTTFSHFAFCPTLGEPILLRIIPDPPASDSQG